MKKILSAFLISTAILFTTGCGAEEDDANVVIVYNWGEYIDPEMLEQFEEETGIRVIYDEFETNETMYPKVEIGAAEYDVVCPSDYMISKMIQNDLLMELDFERLPNAKQNIGTQYWQQSEGLTPETGIPYLIVGELSEFYIIKRWLMNRLRVGHSSGTKNTAMKS